MKVISTALARHGPLTRAEVADHLLRAGLGIDTTGQAVPHLLGRGGLQGVLCRGPDRGREPTYVRLDDWLAPGAPAAPVEPDAALSELARRYLGAYGPATPEDLAHWSGLPRRLARHAWGLVGPELVAETCDIGRFLGQEPALAVS